MNPDNGHGAGDGQGGEDFPCGEGCAHPEHKPAGIEEELHAEGVPLWDAAQFAFLEGIQARTEVQPLTRVEASALVLSWIITGLAKNVQELELMAGGSEGDIKTNAKLIADICGAFVGQMKNDIDAMMQTRRRVLIVGDHAGKHRSAIHDILLRRKG